MTDYELTSINHLIEEELREIPELIPETSEEDRRFNEIAELSKSGYLLLKDNCCTEAVHAFEKILAIDERNNYALVGLGDAERKKENYGKAAEFYSVCLEFHPGNNYALFGLADCYKSLGQYAKAIEIWKQYLEYDNKNITVLTRVADAYRKVRDFKRSKVLYLRVLDMEEDNPYALIGLGHLHYDFREYRDALYYWQKMVSVSEGAVDIRVLTSIGNCYRKLKNFDKGIYYFQRALEQDDDNFYALFGLADCYRGLNQQQKSLEYWHKILDSDPDNKVILTRVGDAYRNMGDFDMAEKYYQRALDIAFDIYAVLGIAMINKRRGKFDEAIRTLEQLIQSEPRNYRLYIELADCYLAQKKKMQAIDVLLSFQRFGIRNQAVCDLLRKLQAPQT